MSETRKALEQLMDSVEESTTRYRQGDKTYTDHATTRAILADLFLKHHDIPVVPESETVHTTPELWRELRTAITTGNSKTIFDALRTFMRAQKHITQPGTRLWAGVLCNAIAGAREDTLPTPEPAATKPKTMTMYCPDCKQTSLFTCDERAEITKTAMTPGTDGWLCGNCGHYLRDAVAMWMFLSEKKATKEWQAPEPVPVEDITPGWYWSMSAEGDTGYTNMDPITRKNGAYEQLIQYKWYRAPSPERLWEICKSWVKANPLPKVNPADISQACAEAREATDGPVGRSDIPPAVEVAMKIVELDGRHGGMPPWSDAQKIVKEYLVANVPKEDPVNSHPCGECGNWNEGRTLADERWGSCKVDGANYRNVFIETGCQHFTEKPINTHRCGDCVNWAKTSDEGSGACAKDHVAATGRFLRPACKDFTEKPASETCGECALWGGGSNETEFIHDRKWKDCWFGANGRTPEDHCDCENFTKDPGIETCGECDHFKPDAEAPEKPCDHTGHELVFSYSPHPVGSPNPLGGCPNATPKAKAVETCGECGNYIEADIDTNHAAGCTQRSGFDTRPDNPYANACPFAEPKQKPQ